MTQFCIIDLFNCAHSFAVPSVSANFTLYVRFSSNLTQVQPGMNTDFDGALRNIENVVSPIKPMILSKNTWIHIMTLCSLPLSIGKYYFVLLADCSTAKHCSTIDFNHMLSS